MFGGENTNDEYEKDLYCLTFPDNEFSAKDAIPPMTCELVVTKGPCPVARSSHSAVAYADRFLIIIGGEALALNSKGKKGVTLLNDVWCFDTENSTWV